MDRRSRFVLAAAAALGLVGCADDAVVAPQGDPLLARVAAMGFDIAGIQDAGDHFVVEGDILLRKADIPAAGSTGGRLSADPLRPSHQYRTTNRVQYTYYYDLRVDYSSITDPAWVTAIDQAIAAWNAVPGSEAHLTKWDSTQFYSPHITITFGSCGSSNAIACASWPSSAGTPGPTINIAQPTSGYKLYTIAHEIGHTLGLRHTNWNNRPCSSGSGICQESAGPEGAVHIPNTPTSTYGGAQSDPNSVMNAVVQPWNGFSFYDRVAVRYLYPGGRGPQPSVALSGSTPVISWPAMLDATSYDIYFQEYENQWDPVFGSWPTQVYRYVGSTTGTTITDSSRSFNNNSCYWAWPIGYVVRAHFADGTVTGYSQLGCVGN